MELEALLSQLRVTLTAMKRKAAEAEIISGSEPDESDPENKARKNNSDFDLAISSKLMKLAPTSQRHTGTTSTVMLFDCRTN